MVPAPRDVRPKALDFAISGAAVTLRTSPRSLFLRLAVYHLCLTGAVFALFFSESELLRYLPFSGIDAFDRADIEVTETSVRLPRELLALPHSSTRLSPSQVMTSALFLLVTLITTLLVMIPMTWTYLATRFDAGPSKVFVRSLLLLPICATTVVLLIRDSLALAFGLAALVAAVRFRVSLPEPIDGIYIFAAICVGLAAGIGFMGVAFVMTLVFSYTHAVLWTIDYGRNPIDNARHDAASLKLEKRLSKR
ncbi:MAG: hypothetical protein V2I82_16210 [Halieaceae bacterium]|jgi:hypothetical protein|nr:hypothetical protein [Halieaceae bacterium]